MPEASAEAGAGLSFLREGLVPVTALLPRPPDEELSSEAEEPPELFEASPPEVSAALEDSAREPPREPPRVAVLFAGALLAAEVSDPEDPAEPFVSAKAIGIAEIAEPTPRASARAPTRPT